MGGAAPYHPLEPLPSSAALSLPGCPLTPEAVHPQVSFTRWGPAAGTRHPLQRRGAARLGSAPLTSRRGRHQSAAPEAPGGRPVKAGAPHVGGHRPPRAPRHLRLPAAHGRLQGRSEPSSGRCRGGGGGRPRRLSRPALWPVPPVPRWQRRSRSWRRRR